MSNAADEQRIENLIEEDQRARERALDVTQSFLVQAPAGSGKTELLIRRMLALLAQVDRPERILAMTFTRKAAAEMRERIVAALRAARADAPLTSPHEQPTRDLALAVLAQDARQQWHLIEQPSRLRMMTIDAFCAQLLRQTPLTSRWGAMPSFEEFVQPRYEAAVREALRDADDEAQPFWCEVLKTLGNNGNRLVETMSALLMKREQWLPLFGCALRQDQRTMLQSVLSVEVENELTNIRGVLQRMWSATERETLRAAMRYAAGHLDESPPLPSLSPCPSPASGRGEAFPSSLPLAGE
ncbi:MAG: UvrD-helicase domain-containing protein, partial [Proteobacteria bacterium]|nr:UvrD-helicase domain-containing protein [Pseudomonadota bacterium]